MMTIMLYECDLCYLVQDFYSLSKLLGGRGGGGGGAWTPKTVNSAFKFEVNVCGINFTHGS